MVSVSNLQTKIENKIFSALGSSCLMSSTVVTSLDEWGDPARTSPAATTVTFVPWNMISPKQQFYNFGDLQEGDMFAAFRYDEPIAIGYVIQFLSSSYEIKEIEKFPLQNELLVQLALLRKQLARG